MEIHWYLPLHLGRGSPTFFQYTTAKGSRVARVKITVSGKPNIFNYCVIFILYIIRKCGRGPRVGHGWFREKSGGKGQFWNKRFRHQMEKTYWTNRSFVCGKQLGVWETAQHSHFYAYRPTWVRTVFLIYFSVAFRLHLLDVSDLSEFKYGRALHILKKLTNISWHFWILLL
jgi:hypothetical protein